MFFIGLQHFKMPCLLGPKMGNQLEIPGKSMAPLGSHPPAVKVCYLRGNDQRHLVKNAKTLGEKNKVTLEIREITQTLQADFYISFTITTAVLLWNQTESPIFSLKWQGETKYSPFVCCVWFLPVILGGRRIFPTFIFQHGS